MVRFATRHTVPRVFHPGWKDKPVKPRGAPQFIKASTHAHRDPTTSEIFRIG